MSEKTQRGERGKLSGEARRALARRLQEALCRAPLDFPAMEATLGQGERGVLAALRLLGSKTDDCAGLRSGFRAGRACWWWEAGSSP